MLIPVKAYYGGEIRRFQADASGVAGLRDTLFKSFSVPQATAGDLQLSYADDASEWVTLVSDEDFAIALSLLEPNAPLRLRLTGPGTADEAAQLLQNPKVQAFIEGLVNETIQKPIFDTMVQDMLPTVVKLMDQNGMSFCDRAIAGSSAVPEFQYKRFSEVDPHSSVILPSICLEDVEAAEDGANPSSGEGVRLEESLASGGGLSTDSMIEAMRFSLGSAEDFSLTSVDFSALSAMLEQDLMGSQRLKEKERMLLEHAAEVDGADSSLLASSSSVVEPKPRPDSSAENLTVLLEASPVTMTRSEHASRAADAIESSFVVMDASSSLSPPPAGDTYNEADLMQSLRELGFNDTKKNKNLIEVFRDDLAAIVEVLLESGDATPGHHDHC